MKAISYTLVSVAAISCLAFAGVALAQGIGIEGRGSIQTETNLPTKAQGHGEIGANASSSAGTKEENNLSATGSAMAQEHSQAGIEATSTEKSGPSAAGIAHRSAVANVVQNLLSLASSTQGGIGQEVRMVAMEQASTSAQNVQAEDALSQESALKVFFFGPSYKNIGLLRSSLVTTQNDINRLTQAMNSTSDVSAKADLSIQIQALQQNASSTQAYLSAHENVFNLFGWFVRFFAGS